MKGLLTSHEGYFTIFCCHKLGLQAEVYVAMLETSFSAELIGLGATPLALRVNRALGNQALISNDLHRDLFVSLQ